MVRLISKKLVPFLMILTLLTFTITSFYQTQSFALSLAEEDEISYDENNNPYRTGQLIVGYRGNMTANEKRSLRATLQLEVKANLKSINAEVIQVGSERAREVLSNLKRNPNVMFAEYDYLANVDHVPDDVYYPYQTYLHYMNAAEAWDYSKGSPNVTVAVIDTGILTGNRDLSNINVSGYNIGDSNTDYTDPTGHGTGVISVIAGEMDNLFGIAGVAPESAFMVLRVIDEAGYTTYSDLIMALEYATEHGADVVNMSVSGRSDSLSLKLAVDNAYNNGITIVAAAGNEGTTTVSYPAAYSNVIGVGAVNTSGDLMTFSNTGNGLTVVAGGSAMIATATDYITSASGTSFAAPYMTGLAALMYAVDDQMTPQKVMSILEATSTDLGASGYDTSFGYGVINMGAAVSMAAGGTTMPPLEDIVPPIVTLKGDSLVTLEIGTPFVDPGVIAVDDIDGDLSAKVLVEGLVDTEVLGQYTLSYSVQDQAGNLSNIEMRTVEVIAPDMTPPVLTLNGDPYMEIILGGTYTEPGAVAMDDVDGDISESIVIVGGVDTNKIGIYSLNYTAVDQAGNTSNVGLRTVEVIEPPLEPDTTPPVLTLNGSSVMDVEIGTPYNEPGAQAVDDVDGDISNQIVITGSVDINTLGFYTLEYSVIDQSGNVSNIETRTVEVFEYVELVEETIIIRDTDVFSGSLSRKSNMASHTISVVEPGQLDLDLSFTGKAPPTVAMDGQTLVGTSGSFTVDSGSHTITVESDANTKYTLTATHPEREVPVGTPTGPTDIVPDRNLDIFIYIVLGFMLVLATVYVFNKFKPKFSHHD